MWFMSLPAYLSTVYSHSNSFGCQFVCVFVAPAVASQNLMKIFSKSRQSKSEWRIRLSIYILFSWEPQEPQSVFQRCFKSICENVLLWLCFSLTVTLESLLWSPLSLPQVQCCLFPPFFTLCLLSSTQVSCCNLCDILFSRRLKHINLFSEMHCCKCAQQKRKPLTSLCISLSLILSHFVSFCHLTAQLGHI